VSEGSGSPAPPTSASSESTTESEPGGTDDDSARSVAGAILIGLLAGCVLFGLGLLCRKGWMHWRYGL